MNTSDTGRLIDFYSIQGGLLVVLYVIVLISHTSSTIHSLIFQVRFQLGLQCYLVTAQLQSLDLSYKSISDDEMGLRS